MTDTLIKVDLSKSPVENENVHNRWHPDIPMACWVNPGDDFILETFDWTGGFIKNDDSADDVRDIDLSTVHYLSGPVGIKGAEPGDLHAVARFAALPQFTRASSLNQRAFSHSLGRMAGPVLTGAFASGG